MRANEEISQLESWNESLARQIERLDLPLPGDTTYTDLLARVDRLPPGLIRQQLRYLFDDDYVDGIENPNDLAKELIEIALRENEDIEDDDESPALRVGVEFSLSPVRGVRTFYDLDEVDAYDRIFAHFAASQPYANLIVRWQHRTTGEILQFESLQLGASQEIYRSMRPPNGWKSGQYQVSLYDLNNDRKLVGSNSYQISSVINPPSGEIAESQADQDVINDLVSSGKAVSKSF